MPNTDELIRNLAGDLKPMPPLRSPLLRCAAWTAGSLIYIVVIAMSMTPADTVASRASDAGFVLQQFAALATAAAMAYAALCMTVPGYGQRLSLPLAAAAAAGWIGIVCVATIQDWMAAGAAGLALRSDWQCVAGIVLTGAVPALALAIMLRRGAPLAPRPATALAALGVASLANIGMCVAEPHERAVIILVWHGVTIAGLAAVGASAGRTLLRWNHMHGRP
jgi:hypothetical protein